MPPDALKRAFDSLSSRSLLIFGGKGGVGKTTIASLAAVHLSATREVVLFSSDPASNLRDLFAGVSRENLTVEELNADALYRSYLQKHLESFLELGDRGTLLDKGELRRLLELSLPGVDELMSWIRIGDLVGERAGRMVIVDSAPTGHALRMLGASRQFVRFGEALQSMQAKHRDLVTQLTRQVVRDAMDAFLERFRSDAAARIELLSDPARSAFVPVLLAERWVIDQTCRLVAEVEEFGADVPLAILNQETEGCDCIRCTSRREAERQARAALAPIETVGAPRWCRPLDDLIALESYLRGDPPAAGRADSATESRPLELPEVRRIVFFAGKGGVGKTTASSSVALQLAAAEPQRRVVLVSVDPAHSVRDVFRGQQPPANLAVETVDTALEWKRLRGEIGEELDRAISALTRGRVSVVHDVEVVRQLVDMAPPGADEIFAVIRLHDLLTDDEKPLVIVDTAPTGHFLRLLDLPQTATAWVKELMRILLSYKELIPPSTLGAQLVRASRALAALEETMHSEEASCVVVCRPEKLVVDETRRLVDAIAKRGLRLDGIVANAVTPADATDCRCDSVRRSYEAEILRGLGAYPTVVELRAAPVLALADLRALVPLRQTRPA